MLLNTSERTVKIAQESRCQSGPLLLVPFGGICQISLGERSND